MKTLVCKWCAKEFHPSGPRSNNVKFCSRECREASYQPYRSDWARKNRNLKAENPRTTHDKCQCKICGRWYRKVGSHAVNAHGYESARVYKEEHGLDVKRGITKEPYREIMREHVFSNGTVENLKKGQKFWFKKGDKTAGRYERSPETMARLKEHFAKVASRKGRPHQVEKIKILCAYCGKAKLIYPRAYREGNNFCGMKCRNIANNKKRSGFPQDKIAK